MNLLRTTTSFFALISWTFASRATEEDSMVEVWVVSGGRASLPCVPRPKVPGDQPVLVLWYRRFSSSLPIYSYDARVGDFSNGVRWWDEVVLGRRGYFVPSSTPSLVLEPAHAHDQDVYSCRIDYRVSTSTTTRVNLTVLVPPGPPVVMWEGREIVGTVGPLQENQLTELTCRSEGGRPAPSLTWLNEGRELPLLHSHSSWDPVTGTSIAEATTSVTAKRELQGASLTCYARTPSQPSTSGDTTILPRSASVSLSITLFPVEVRILEQDAVVATSGSTVSVVCRALGSHPPAELSWWRGIRSLEPHVTHAIRDGGNITTATLTIAVTGEDDGATITCTGANPALPHEPLSDRRKLIVYYEPIVDLSLGKQLEAENIKEEDDVSFECHIKSNPKFHRIEWHHNGQDIPQNVSAGVVISGQSLVLRSVARSHSGSYACAATNAQGRTVSNTLFLTVKHAPTCAGSAGQERTQGAARGAAVKARCRVEAEPPSDLTWSWVRQRTDGSEEILSPDKYVVEGLTSTLTVVPETREDYGRLLCRATNGAGRQKEPCVVNLVPAGPPDTPTNCSATPVNPDALMPALAVSCLEGFDGGLPQNFLLEAWQDGVVLANVSSEYPEWVVSGMEVGKGVVLNIMGHNARGRSDPVTMKVVASSAQHRSAPGLESSVEISPVVGAVLGVLGVILVLLLVGTALVRRTHSHPRKPVIIEKSAASPSSKGLDPDVVQSIKRLDVIPCVQEDHTNQEAEPIFAYSEHGHPLGEREEPEGVHDISAENIGGEALLPCQVQVQLHSYDMERERVNISHDQSDDSGVSESESDNEIKLLEEEGSSPEGEEDQPYFVIPNVGTTGRGDSPCQYPASKEGVPKTKTCSPGKELSKKPLDFHQKPLPISLREGLFNPSSRIPGSSQRVPSAGGQSASPVEVIRLAVTSSGVLNPATNAQRLPDGDTTRILRDVGVPVTLYKAENGELLLLPRRPSGQEGTVFQFPTTQAYKMKPLPKASGKKGEAIPETTVKGMDSSPIEQNLQKLPTVTSTNKGKLVGGKGYVLPAQPDVCRWESSV
ncbi:uncharacterized protein LOC135213183 [Macrobrachium nipponense]|uniref:uncharacterized protein LOC135213183 n=1 Tax=Macrobrachium nipponense TaxID=159736 RepID=UPI0030C86B87